MTVAKPSRRSRFPYEPRCVLTYAIPPAPAIARSFFSSRRELVTIFGSSLARLIRYDVWIATGPIPAASREAAKRASAGTSIAPTRYVFGFPAKNCRVSQPSLRAYAVAAS